MDSSSNSVLTVSISGSQQCESRSAYVWCSAGAPPPSLSPGCHLICTGCHGINTFLSFPSMFAHAWVCSGIFLLPLCHRVMSDSCSTFPPCLSAATCPSPSITLCFSLLVCDCQWISSSSLEQTHTHTLFSLLSAFYIHKYVSPLLPNVTCRYPPVNVKCHYHSLLQGSPQPQSPQNTRAHQQPSHAISFILSVFAPFAHSPCLKQW